MEIKIEDLKLITEMLFAHLEELQVETVELTQDYYWDIDREQNYDPYKQPDNLRLGQLSDDWNDLLKLLNGHSEPLASDLIDLAGILRAIGYNVRG